VAWLLFWAVSDWRRRRNFIWGFTLTLGLLCAGAEYVLPGWLGRFRDAITAYRQYNDGAQSILEVLVTPEWGRVVAGVVVLALAVMAWRFRQVSNEVPAFNLMLALVLTTTVVIVPKAAPYNQVLLLPAILLVVRNWQALWERNRWSRMLSMTCGLLLFWPWLAATALTIVSIGWSADAALQAWAVPVWTMVVIPLAVLMLLACNLSHFLTIRNDGQLPECRSRAES
jgi:hypothetical protein